MRFATFCLLTTNLVLAGAVSAQNAAPMKSSAPEKMLPADEARKMRVCDKQAMDRKIKMEDRTSFVAKCMAELK